MLESRDLEQIAMLLEKSAEKTNEKISGIESKISGMEEKMTKMQEDILNIQLTLENVTNRNIKIIAEGHLDLSRKLNQALEVRDKEELALIRLNALEEDVRRIKIKLEQIAQQLRTEKEPLQIVAYKDSFLFFTNKVVSPSR